MTPDLVETPVILFGSWKIRHQEPLNSEDHVLHAIDARHMSRGAMTTLIDLRGTHAVVASWRGNHQLDESPAAQLDCANIGVSEIPLAVAILRTSGAEITHLVTRIDLHRTLFVQPAHPVKQPDSLAAVPAALRQAFQLNYLAVNNWECRYEYPDAELVERFDVDSEGDARTLGEAWYEAVDAGLLAPFVSQCGDEFQLWDHDVTACRAIPTGYVAAEHWSRKRKITANEPLAQLRCVDMPGKASSGLVEAHIETPVVDSMAVAVDAPLQALGEYRRIAFSTQCESVETGQIFSVTFETCISESHPLARTTRGQIRFLKTRGKLNRLATEAELARLMLHVREFLSIKHLDYRPARPEFAFMRQPAPASSIS
ncbi:MAG: hypothetical protein ACRYHA_32980 [Janthinobacterium lividum]